MSYEDDMRIDEDALDVELLEQSSLMVKYSRLLAEAKQDRDISKEALELKKAEINLDVRDHPQNYSLEKVTDKAVEACILQSDEYQEAIKVLNEANFEVNVLQGVVNAIEHRKSALENLVKLYIQGYFAGPSIPHDLTAEREKRSADASHRIGKTLKREKPKK